MLKLYKTSRWLSVHLDLSISICWGSISPSLQSYLVGGFSPTHLKKYATVKLGSSSPGIRGEHKKYLSCHHLVMYLKRCTNLLKSTIIFPQNASDSHRCWFPMFPWAPLLRTSPSVHWSCKCFSCRFDPDYQLRHDKKTWGSRSFPDESVLFFLIGIPGSL